MDNAHNFYMPHCGLASFNSLRKFFNLKDGAFLNISKNLDETFAVDTNYYQQFDKMSYEEMVCNENRLNNQDIKLMSACTSNYFAQIDIEKEKIKRMNKFNEFHKRFRYKNMLKLNLTDFDVPFVYPYLTYDDTEAEILEKEGYLILRYWNFLPDNFPEYKFYRHLIPIPLV